MSSVVIRAKSAMSKNLGHQNELLTFTFKAKSLKLSNVLTKSGLKLDERKISFFAINGVRCSGEDWVFDGDIIEIFPVVRGG